MSAVVIARRTVETLIFDVDGTLIDSNAAHAETWAQALQEHGIAAAVGKIRPLVGMGGDKLLAAVAALEDDSPLGKSLVRRKKALFADRLPGLQPTRGARLLLEHLREQGVTVGVATSADGQEMEALLEQAGVADLLPARASKDDAAESKPDPDIVEAALKQLRARPGSTAMVGDTPYDIAAAKQSGVITIALRCGGYWRDEELQEAYDIFDDPAALLEHLRAPGSS